MYQIMNINLHCMVKYILLIIISSDDNKQTNKQKHIV